MASAEESSVQMSLLGRTVVVGGRTGLVRCEMEGRESRRHEDWKRVVVARSLLVGESGGELHKSEGRRVACKAGSVMEPLLLEELLIREDALLCWSRWE